MLPFPNALKPAFLCDLLRISDVAPLCSGRLHRGARHQIALADVATAVQNGLHRQGKQTATSATRRQLAAVSMVESAVFEPRKNLMRSGLFSAIYACGCAYNMCT